ncbi:MAG: GHKL domain-containing protein [Desulfomonile sp.]|nr:GHKL domain-containing protein [Desulfomonile sp.]
MDSKHYAALRTKIVAATLCFSLIPLFSLGITIYYQFHAAYTQKIEESLRTLVQNRRSALELFFDERVSQLITVVQTHSMERLVDEDYLARLFNVLQARSKSFIDLGVIDQDGTHLAYVGPHYDKLKVVNYSGEDWFTGTLSSGVYISDVFLGFRKVPHFVIAVSKLEGNRTWILRATINSDIIDNIVRAGQLGKKGDAFIVNRRNILQTQPRFAGTLLAPPEAPDFAAVSGTHVETITYNGETCLYGASGLNHPRWVLVVKEDPTAEMAPLFRARFVEALIIMAGTLLVVVGTIFTARAMTNELIRVEAEKSASDDLLIQSQKMAALGKLAAGVAHEINNPLQIIAEKAGWMKDLLEEEEVSKSENFQEFQDCVVKIERQLERCRSITHRLLRFGRRMEPAHEMVDINQLLAETITFLENEAHFREIAIVREYDEQLPKITTDPTQIQQVFLNIIDNALDAVGKDGKITIKTSVSTTSPREVVIEISDTGPGIPKEHLAKIFDPFFTTKSPGEGTGLGLSISHSTIERLGGRITVSSEQGVGTTFRISLPAT